MTPTFAFILGVFLTLCLIVLILMGDEVYESNKKLRIEHFHIGFKYQQLIHDPNRYLNRGMIWVDKEYTLTSPRLFKIQQLIDEGKVRFPK